LTCDTSTLTALANDYGPEEIFARQVRAHGRSGDVLVLLSTSGASANLVAAATAARQRELITFALTGSRPNLLADGCDEAVYVEGAPTPSVQEAHLVAVHLLCSAFDAALFSSGVMAGAHRI
jgi:D-sedoheptulose 7-phosphate isomerase